MEKELFLWMAMPEAALCYLQGKHKEWKTLVMALRWLKIIDYERDGSEGLRAAVCWPGEFQNAPST